MASLVTLGYLIDNARLRADMVGSDFVADEELTAYVNASLSELHDLLISAYGDQYSVEQTTLNTAPNSDTVALPDDFYKLCGLDQPYGGAYIALETFNFVDRNVYQYGAAVLGYYGQYYRYRVIGSTLRLVPTPTSIITLRLWYVPVAPVLEDVDDTYDDVNGYGEYIIVDAAIKCLQKEESDVSVLMAQKMALMQRIERMRINRIVAEPQYVQDVTSYWPNGRSTR